MLGKRVLAVIGAVVAVVAAGGGLADVGLAAALHADQDRLSPLRRVIASTPQQAG
jgi:hypothetical protein